MYSLSTEYYQIGKSETLIVLIPSSYPLDCGVVGVSCHQQNFTYGVLHDKMASTLLGLRITKHRRVSEMVYRIHESLATASQRAKNLPRGVSGQSTLPHIFYRLLEFLSQQLSDLVPIPQMKRQVFLRLRESTSTTSHQPKYLSKHKAQKY